MRELLRRGFVVLLFGFAYLGGQQGFRISRISRVRGEFVGHGYGVCLVLGRCFVAWGLYYFGRFGFVV